jgi:hypothetical protein
MSFLSLLIHTVGIRNRTTGSTDRYGNEVTTFATAVSTPARVDQVNAGSFGGSTEYLGDRDTTVTWFRVFLPATVTIGPLDRVEWGTRTFEVDGFPETFYDSVGAHHKTAWAKELEE